MGWVEDLNGQTVGVDTAPFIYYIEGNPAYKDTLKAFFQAVDQGKIKIVTSTVTLLETLIHPLRTNNNILAQQYRDILFGTKGLTTLSVSQNIAQEAARIRALHNVRTPDAIQLATAISSGATFFLTNDKLLPSLPNLKMLVLNDLRTRP
ncbi:type II toxin-antitoxin system VapC family toxin [Ktedonobacter robiniae]|uniref:Motility twitching protein PilT n=1 Tax=Ktedonobacter robiniae TaxID=2778365 RepID=A0ABQ3UKW0_9CHLR|nr:PIN domain-containing protein [Ktedonobacter robiniae]GHO53368.1 motility twitching protein PilT [Ktedonobacter robiniae]